MPTRHTLLVVLAATCLASCGKPATPPKPASSASAPPATPTPAITLGTGFTYDPDDLTPGFPGLTTIRLGDRIRIYSRASDTWTPATLSVLDRYDNVIASIRLDIPPAGSITGALPPTPEPPVSIRIACATADFDATRFERRIGIPEAELTTDRFPQLELAPTAGDSWTAATSETETTLDPHFGRVVIIEGSSSYIGVSDEWKGQGPITDEHWLDERIKIYLKNIHNDRRTRETNPPSP